MMGHREVNNRGPPGRQLPLEEKQGWGNQRSQVPDQGEVGRVPGRPIKERAVASSSSAERAITQEMVAEACDTLVRERHPASPPVWPQSSGIPAPECRLDPPDTTTGGGIWTARMHNSTVCRVLDGLVDTRRV